MSSRVRSCSERLSNDLPGRKLFEVLEGNPTFLKETSQVWRFIERIFVERGRPEDCDGLLSVLEDAMNRCKMMHFTYPKFVLFRKKQLERGEWQPKERVTC